MWGGRGLRSVSRKIDAPDGYSSLGLGVKLKKELGEWTLSSGGFGLSPQKIFEIDVCTNAIFAYLPREGGIVRPSGTIVRPPGTVVPDGLLFYRRFFSGSHISEAPRPIAAKLCHMIAIWLESPAKVGQVWGPPLKNFRGQKHAKFPSIFCNVRI